MKMSKYLIHTNPKRIQYVNDFLLPSLLEQGICRTDIIIYNDYKQQGSLKAYIESINELPEGYTWHLQDDIIISPDFKKVTDRYGQDDQIVCGFASEMYDKDAPAGYVSKSEMWFSFLCIGIPNQVAKDSVEWMQKYMIGNPAYRDYWIEGNNIDWFFKQYIRTEDKKCKVMNLAPNIVEHIDYLIGGSTLRDRKRLVPARSKYWNYPELVEELKEKLKNGMVNN